MTFPHEKVDIRGNDNRRKLLSIAQDVISLASQGRKLMPKHVALGMTIRHLTGSSKIQELLNSFGHCVSHSVTLEHDTALATQQLQRGSDVPHGFRPHVFTALICDNDDSGEETLTGLTKMMRYCSGKGTTHNTNGVIIQRIGPDAPRSPQKNVPMQRDRKRTIDAPSVDIGHFYGKKRTGPIQFQGQNPDLDRKIAIQEEFKSIDLSLQFAKSMQTDVPLPGWTGCNIILSRDSRPLNNIGYLPVIDASPTELSTVNAILEKSLDIANALDLSCVVLVMDQAIYAKAQEIRWQGRPEFRDQLILRLGEFHTAMAFLSATGKRFENAGLKDIAIESGLVAEGSINGVMSGHHYNRSLRCHKVISEAMHRLRIQEFVDQLPSTEYEVALKAIQDIHDSFPSEFLTAVRSDTWAQFLKHYQAHVELKCRQNVMYAFWTSYLEMVDLLLLFIRATREGNWELHLSTIRDMIPWFFSCGRINYSRYLPCYFLEMKALPSTHPFVHARLTDGEFAVKRHEDHGFALTAGDQIIEQTYNRDSKTRGGLTGITLNKGAVRRWILSHPARAAIANACYSLASSKHENSPSSSELTSSRISKDEQAVQDVMTTVIGFSNPFNLEQDTELMNICSGKVAPENVKSDLSSAYARGEKCFQQFVDDRLVEGTKDVYDKLTLPTGKTFSDIEKKVPSKTNLENASMKEKSTFASQTSDCCTRERSGFKGCFEVSSVPTSLASFDGSMAKTNKATLMHEVEKQMPKELLTREIIFSSETVMIIDAMAMVQQQRHFPDTFGKFADLILDQLVSMGKRYRASRIDFVADRYKLSSIKQSERNKRATQGETRVHINRADQKMPKQMKKFLACGNKEELLSFLVDEWKKCSPHRLSSIQLFATQGELCYKLQQSTEGTVIVEDVPALHCDHEEADTRMFLHAMNASQSCSEDTDIIIRTVDTDVFVLAIWVASKLPCRLILQLTTGKSRSIDVTKMNENLGNIADALVGLHPFTGCARVSAFKGKGKAKGLKLILTNDKFRKTFVELGQEWTVQDSLLENLEQFVCVLYGWNDCDSVDSVRYNSFRFGNVSDLTMPPNSDSLKLHIHRANYQAGIYRRCLHQNVSAPSPASHGWIPSDSGLVIKWNSMPIAPDNILQSINCKCIKSSCNSTKCSCKKAGMECTDLCRCSKCQNRTVAQTEDIIVESDESDSDC